MRVPQMAKLATSPRDFGKPLHIPTGERMFVEVSRFEGAILEMEDVNFHFDSAVLLPDPKCDDDPGTPDQDRITGLAVLRVAYLHAQDNPDQELLVAGHTDTTGDAGYNLTLSRHRAENVLFALTGDRDAWVKTADERHRVEDYQHILKWAANTFGWECDPGEIDNHEGPRTHRAVLGFQKRYNLELEKNIAVDGVMGKETWGAFFDVYMMELCILLETDEAGLEKLQKQLKFLPPKTVGCGESHPIPGASADRPGTSESETKVKPTAGQPKDAKGADGFRSVTNRRVELLFFEPGHKPKLDCHPAETKCKPDVCEIYRLGAFQMRHLPCDPRKGTASQVFYLARLPEDAKEDKVNLVITDESGKELERMPASGAEAGPDGNKVFDLSKLDPTVPVLVQLMQGDDRIGTRQRLVIRDLRRALAQQDASAAGRHLAVASEPASTGELDGSDPDLATAVASAAGEGNAPATVAEASALA
jgi:outer membrane protein OmpA-like peptidoglycan-associated protein